MRRVALLPGVESRRRSGMAAKSKMRKTAIARSRPDRTPPPQPKLSHYDSTGRATMVDVSGKPPTVRTAEASARVVMSPKVLAALPANPKGDPFEVARIAGIQAAKRTWELIPMCHPVALSFVDISYSLCEDGVCCSPGPRPQREPGWRWRL